SAALFSRAGLEGRLSRGGHPLVTHARARRLGDTPRPRAWGTYLYCPWYEQWLGVRQAGRQGSARWCNVRQTSWHTHRSEPVLRGRSGGRGIRTHGDVAVTMVFKTIAIGH